MLIHFFSALDLKFFLQRSQQHFNYHSFLCALHLRNLKCIACCVQCVNVKSFGFLRILSVLMISISDVITESFRDRLLHKAEQLLEEKNEVHFNYARRILQFLQNVKLRYHPLLEKCNRIFLENASHLDIHSISHIFGLYEQLGFDNAEFRLIAKQLLSETIDDYYDPETFAKLFFALGPMAGSKVRER